MDDENKIDNNEKDSIVNESINTKNVEEKTGNWFSRQGTAVKIIIGLVAICCVGAIIFFAIGAMTPGGINYEINTENTDHFPNEVSVGGLSFYLPDGFGNSTSTKVNGATNNQYKGADDYIRITLYPAGETISKIKSTFSSNPLFTDIESASYGQYNGFTAEYLIDDGTDAGLTCKLFVFEKDGRIVAIEMSLSELNFDEDIVKII